jgi:translation initiation factor 2A
MRMATTTANTEKVNKAEEEEENVRSKLSTLEVNQETPTPPIRLLFRTATQCVLFGTISKDGKLLKIDQQLKERMKKVIVTVNETQPSSLLASKLSTEGLLSFETLEDGEDTTTSTISDGPFQVFDISPKGTFVVTWNKPQDLVLRKNISNGGEFETLVKLIHKKVPSGETLIQFTKNELFASYQVNNEVRIWNTSIIVNGSEAGTAEATEKETMIRIKGVHRLKLDGLSSHSLCPYYGDDEKPPIIATFQLGKSGMPSSVSLYSGDSKICNATSFRADYCTYKWSPFVPGDVLAKLETTHDATGQSYYGESKLILLSTTKRQAINVVCGKEGAVHDFAWSPRRHVFVVVAGKSPARCTLFDGKTGDPLFEYGESHKNIVSFSPSGRFVCLAGFGNLAGGMDFWAIKKNKLLGSGKADAAVGYGWSPCGRIFMTATLAPRMNVDNGVTLYTYRGEKISHWRADDKKSVLGGDGLLECRFLPVPEGSFPDLPPTPREGKEEADDGQVGKATASKPATNNTGEKKVYRPPGATALTNRIAEEMRGNRQQPAPVGAAKKIQPTAPPTQQKPALTAIESTKKSEMSSKGNSTPQVQLTAASLAHEDEEKDPEKLVRKLKKLLRQIEEIEEKGGPQDDAQKVKVGKKADIQSRLAEAEQKAKQTSSS